MIKFAAILIAVLLTRVGHTEELELASIDLTPKAKVKYGKPGYVRFGVWHMDAQRAFVEPHNYYLFAAINTAYVQSGRLYWLQPIWDGTRGGWLPGPGPKQFPPRLLQIKRRVCQPGGECRVVMTWSWKKKPKKSGK